jgi:D-3-phosphoglycerate dehydrogenase / 2-oxoglutarate reductase
MYQCQWRDVDELIYAGQGAYVYKAVLIDNIFDDISIIKDVLSNIAEVADTPCSNEDEVINAGIAADAIFVVNFSPISKRVIEKLDRCKIISRLGIGIDSVDIRAATKKGIMVTNVPDYCLDEVSDHAIAMMMCLERKLLLANSDVRETHQYRPSILKPIKGFKGSTLGIVGLGRIGKLSARKAIALGLNVIFYDPFIPADWQEESCSATKVEFTELMRLSDYIIIHAPHTPDNYHMINKNSLTLTQNKPIIINVGRGELVDIDALVWALKSGKIASAGLDLIEGGSSVDPNNEILKLENVLLSPHSAWYSEQSIKKLLKEASLSVRDALSGKIPANCVNMAMLREV